MALQDPTDPAGYFDPAIADALAVQSDPYGFEWPPREWTTDDQQIGGTMGVVENAAAPALAAPEVAPTPGGGSAALIENAAAPALEDLSPVAAELGAPSYQIPDQLPAGLKLLHEGETYAEPVPPPLPFTPDPNLRGIQPEKPVEQAGVELGQDPVKLAIAEQDYARRQHDWANEQAQIERNRDQMRAEENYARQREVQLKTQADMDKLNADAAALANTKIDDKRWFKNASTGQKIGAWVAAIVGGLVSGRTGGPNTGLQNILKMIDDDVDAQKFELQNKQQALGARRSVISDNYARSGDMFRAAESYRMASYDRTIANLQSQAQQFDPRSARAIEIGKLIQGVAAQRQAAAMAAQDRYLKTNTAHAELQGKLLDNAAKERKLAGIGAGGAGGGLDKRVMTADQIAGLLPPGAWIPPKAWTGTIAEYGKLAEAANKGQAVSSGATSGMGKEQLEREVILPDGQKFIARGGTEDIGKLRKQVAATNTLTRLMDEAIRIRTGWTSDTAKSAEWRQLQANWAAATGVAKDVLGLGALSGPDMGLVEKFIGTSDPTEFRDPESGILKARENIIGITNDMVTSAGGPKFTIKYIKPDAPKPTDRDRAFLAAQKEPSLTAVISETNRSGKKSGDMSTKEMYGQFVHPGDDPDLDNVVMPDVRAYIERAGSSLKSKDPGEVKDARAALEKLLTTGGNAGIKQAALRQLSILPEYQNPVARGGQ